MNTFGYGVISMADNLNRWLDAVITSDAKYLEEEKIKELIKEKITGGKSE